jgi:thiol-disulfide isomerase/thioredoxin
MAKNMKAIFASIVLFSTLSLSSFASITTLNGKSVVLSDYMGGGEWTIVEVWHSSCPICMKKMPNMVKASGTFTNAKLVGISLDGKLAKAQQVVKRFDINFPTLLTNIEDFSRYIHKVSGKKLLGVPMFLVFSPEGRLKAMQEGDISPAELNNYLVALETKDADALEKAVTEQIIATQGKMEAVSSE